jgi:hypothetical protein
MTTTQTHAAQVLTDAETDQHLDAVLNGAGSALRHYTTEFSLSRMRAAMREHEAAILAKLQPAQAGELPPLPKPFALSVSVYEGNTPEKTYAECMLYKQHPNEKQKLYTADKMHAYARAALAARKPLSVDRIHEIGEAIADGSYGPVGGPMECYQFEPDSLVEFVRAIEAAHGINGLEVKPCRQGGSLRRSVQQG